MSILSHFDRTNTQNYILYRIRNSELDIMMGKIAVHARLCYIANNDLHRLCSTRGITAKRFIEDYVYPDDPPIVSGDFGEIFSYLVVIENFQQKGFVLFAPRK